MDKISSIDPGFDIKAQAEKVRLLIERIVAGKAKELLSNDGGAWKYMIYVRRSTDRVDKQQRTVFEQTQECQDYMKRENLRGGFDNLVVEKKSAKRSGVREKFRAMLNTIEAGKYDGIVAWAPDRLTRNALEGGEIIDLLDRGVIKDIRFVTTGFTNDGPGKMMLGLAFLMAKEYTDRRSVDMKRTQKSRTLEGRSISGHVKPGYYKGKGQFLHPDGENWMLMYGALHMRLEGKRHKEIAEYLIRAGFPVSTVHNKKPKKVVIDEAWVSKNLANPVYCGILAYDENITSIVEQDQFVPMITPDEFEAIFKMSNSHARNIDRIMSVAKEGRKADLMNGMVFCSVCKEARISSISHKYDKKTREITRYFYYVCRTHGCKEYNKSVRAKVILDAAQAYLRQHPFGTPETYNRYVAEMHRLIEQADKEHVDAIRRLEMQAKSLTRDMGDIKQYLVDPAREKDAEVERMYRQDLKGKKKELDEIKEKTEAARERREKAKTAIVEYEKFVKLSQNIAQILDEKAGMKDLDFIMRKLFSNLFARGKTVTKIQQNSPFQEPVETKQGHRDDDPVVVTPGGVEPPLQA